MELNEIEAFITINQMGSFTRAAKHLHLSQPAISRRIELIERELGAPLFDRIPSGARLTQAGEAFLPFAQRVLASMQDGRAAVRAIEEEDLGAITLALVGTLANTRLTRRLRAFRDAYPQVRLVLRTARSDEVGTLVQQGEAHLGLRYFADERPDLQSQLVAHEKLLGVSAPHSQFLRDQAALLAAPWVSFPSNSGSSGEPFARLIERQLSRFGLEASERITIDSLSAQKRLIEADFGLGFVPASSVREELQLGTLRLLPVAEIHAEVPVMLLTRHQSYLSQSARHLISVLMRSDDAAE